MRSLTPFSRLVVLVTLALSADGKANAVDWPMFGRDATRNPVSPESKLPLDWNIGEFDRENRQWIKSNARNMKWVAPLGSVTCGDPVVADGLVWVGTNNHAVWENWDRRHDASVLACFRESDGKLLYKYVSPRMLRSRMSDWPFSSIACSPLVEGDRLWFVTNRWETVCLDIGALKRAEGEPRIVWKCDMIKQLGVFPRGAIMNITRFCSVASYKDRIYVVTGNGVDETWLHVPAPAAPSLVCLQKESGDVLWKDNSPSANILSGQWASPLVVEIDRRGQVIAPQGDGWVRSFDAMTGELIWKFDMNHKVSKWVLHGRGTRNNILATPVFYDNRVYLAAGQNEQNGEGPGRLCCIDPTKKGDISSELAIDSDGNPLPHRRIQAVDPMKGEKAIPNPNSGLIWEYTEFDQDGSGETDFEETFHRTLCNVAIKDGLLVAGDFSGLVHCFDARTGQRHWAYDVLATIYGSPLIADDKVLIADMDGDVAIFNLSANPKQAMRELHGELEPLNTMNMGGSIYTSPIFANNVLYVASSHRLSAIQVEAPEDEEALAADWPQWRGPNRDNMSTDTGLLREWPKDGPPLVWRVEGLGQGIASVAIADGRVFTLGYADEQEYVTAVSEESGEQLWMVPIGPTVAEGRLMRWLGQRTPTVDDERLYAIRSDGDLVCLHVEDGRELWRKSYIMDFGAQRHFFGICDYPLVDGDKLICSPGGSEAAIVALNKKSGEVIWRTTVGDKGSSNYAATIVTDGGGIRHYVAYVRGSLVGVAANDGRVLWRYEKLAASFANSLTPIVRGNSLLAYNGYRSGRALLTITPDGDGVKLQEEYFHKGFLDPFQDSTFWVGDFVHTFRQRGILERFDARTGEETTLSKRIGRSISSMTYADGRLFLRKSDGVVSLIEATDDDYVERSRFTIPDHEPSMGATNPVVTGGRLLLRDDDRLFCYNVHSNSLEHPILPALVTLRRPTAKNTTDRPSRPPRSVFVPTPHDVVEKMLEYAKVKKSDVVYDLGSGDGRIVITAAEKYDCQSIGYEIDKDLVDLSRARAKEAGVEQRVKIEHKDIFTVDLTHADVIAVYLLPNQLEDLIPQFAKLKPGSRIVSNQFEIPGVTPDETVEVESQEDGSSHKIHLWRTPLVSRYKN